MTKQAELVDEVYFIQYSHKGADDWFNASGDLYGSKERAAVEIAAYRKKMSAEYDYRIVLRQTYETVIEEV